MRPQLKPLAEQVIVITGASSGIGLATARMAARRGARLVLNARNDAPLRQLADEINAQGGEAMYRTHRLQRGVEMKTDQEQFAELLLQMLETEQGGVKVYETALRCVVNGELKKEWEKYLSETTQHVQIVTGLIEHFEGDAGAESPGRLVVRHIGQSLVKAMEMALKVEGPKEAAQLVASECVVHAETKDHLNWELLGEAARGLKGEDAKVVKDALSEVEGQEDEHLYHSTGWCRELWIQSLGLPAVLPPPEEEKDVKTAIGAARAKKARREML